MVLDVAGEVLAEWAAVHLPDVPAGRLAFAVDAVVRLTISHIVLPRNPPGEAATALAAVFVRLLE
jgi:hypothetical protein